MMCYKTNICEPVVKKKKLSFGQLQQQLYVPSPWEDTSQFSEEWLNQMQHHQGYLLNIKWFTPDVKTWVDYIFNIEKPKESCFRCRLCHNYATSHKYYNLPLLASANGYLPTTKQYFYQQLIGHASSDIHKKAIKAMKEAQVSTLHNFLDDANKNLEAGEGNDAITARMLRTVYFEIKHNVPFFHIHH